MNNGTLIITSVIFSLNKILTNTNDCGAIHLKVICFEHSFEIIPCIIHPFPEHSSSICQLVTEGHPQPEAMFVNLGNLSRFAFHKLVWSFLVLISAASCGYRFLSFNPNCMRSQLFFFLTSTQPRSLMFLRSFFSEKQWQIHLLTSFHTKFYKFSHVLPTFSQTDDGQPTPYVW